MTPQERMLHTQRATSLLQSAWQEGRIAHAYCFHGPTGSGKQALAMMFAAAVNCEPISAEQGLWPCGECKSCKQARSLQHPNITFVFPTPAPKSGSSQSSMLAGLNDAQVENIRAEMQHKGQDPFYHMVIEGARAIRVSSIRAAKRSASMSASQSGRRFLIVFDADLMNQEAANAFLKTLEEPGAELTIILTTSRKDMMLDTIMSRCQQVQLHPFDEQQIAAYMQHTQQLDPERATFIARLSKGSISQATALLDEDVSGLRAEALNWMRQCLRPRAYAPEVSKLNEQLGRQRDIPRTKNLLSLLQVWLRDALIIQQGGGQDHIVNIDQLQALQRFVDAFGKAEFSHAIDVIDEAVDYLNGNVQIAVALTRLAIRMRRVFFAHTREQ